MDYSAITVKEVVKKIKNNEINILDWNKYFIENVKTQEEKIHAFAFFDEQKWLQQTSKLRNNGSPPFNDLFGVPVGIKDIFNTIDMPTGMGSPIWRGFTPGNDARVVHNIRFHQGIIAGKTVTAEFAVHTPNETRNPWNINYSPGTSSSGSAAAVASRMVPLSLATQTAGSIIRPASYCGIYGFKPSFGTVPRTAMLKTTDSLDTVGLFATNVDDCQLLFDVIRVHGLDYPIANEKFSNIKLQGKTGDRWKVGVVLDQHWSRDNITAYARKSFTDIVNTLSNVSVKIAYPEFSSNFQKAHQIQETIYHKSLSYYFKNEFDNHTLMSPVMYNIVEEGRKITLDVYKCALSLQEELATEVDRLFDGFDILITPSTAGVAPKFGTAIDPPDTCLIWTMCGLPVMNIPLFMYEGMPYGIQVISKKYCDYKLMAFVRDMVTKGLFPHISKIPKAL